MQVILGFGVAETVKLTAGVVLGQLRALTSINQSIHKSTNLSLCGSLKAELQLHKNKNNITHAVNCSNNSKYQFLNPLVFANMRTSTHIHILNILGLLSD